MGNDTDILAAWVRYQQAGGCSERTISSRLYTIRGMIRDGINPERAARDELTDWIAAKPIAQSSRATYHRQIKAFFQWFQDSGRRADDPSAKLPRPRTTVGVPRPLSPGQVEEVLAACADRRARQTRAYFILACFAGLRVHEIAKVRGEDVHGEELRVAGKGGSDSTIPMHPLVAELARSMPKTGWWFPSDSESGHVHRCSVSSAIKRAMTRAGVPGTPHAARHHYGTQVLRASGGDLRTAQRALRHKSVQTTAIYTQVPDDALRRAIAGIPAA